MENELIAKAERGEADAQNELGKYYLNGDERKPDGEESMKWFEKAAAQGHLAAQYNAAFSHYLGRGVEMNVKKAEYWWLKSAAQGDAESQNILGLLYQMDTDIPRNDKAAACWFLKAAYQDHGEAQFRIGVMYDLGRAVPQDTPVAITWWGMAQENGYELSSESKRLTGIIIPTENTKESILEMGRKHLSQLEKDSESGHNSISEL